MANVAGKRCPSCNQFLSRDKFYGRSDRNGQPSSWCKACLKKASLERSKTLEYRERSPHYLRVSRYGSAAAEQYRVMFEEQNGRCAICHREPDGMGGLHIDHDHRTGEVRGLLCASCNMGLGQFKDDPTTLFSAIDYLRLNGGSRPRWVAARSPTPS